MRLQRTRLRAILVLAASLLTLGVGAVAASAATTSMVGIGELVTSAPTAPTDPTATPTTTDSPTEPSDPTDPTATPTTTDSPTEPSDPTCEAECACAEPLPDQTATPAFAGAAWRSHARVVVDPPKSVVIKFKFTTDAEMKVVGFKPAEHVTVEPATFRDYVTGETAVNHAKGCYKISFDSPRFEDCRLQKYEVVVRNLLEDIEGVMLDPEERKENDGAKYTRYFATFGPKRANATFTIWVECLLKV